MCLVFACQAYSTIISILPGADARTCAALVRVRRRMPYPSIMSASKLNTTFLLLVAAALAGAASAFTSTLKISSPRQHLRTKYVPLGPAYDIPTRTSVSRTALNLKVKVDPDAKGGDNVKGKAKMAAYGGSIVFALLLPVAFLVWSAVSK